MTRWDSGRDQLARSLAPRLIRRAVTAGDIAALDAALEPVLPPQSAPAGINLGAAAARFAGARILTRIAGVSIAAQAGYVIGGLAAAQAPPAVWRALMTAPRFVLRRVVGLTGSLVDRGP